MRSLASTSMLAIALLIVSPVSATDLLVDGSISSSGGGTFKTIAEAIAICEDGDRILIRALDDLGQPIIYLEEDLIVERSIEMRSLESDNGQRVRAIIRGGFPMHLDNHDLNDPKHIENARAQQAINFPQQKTVLRVSADNVNLEWLAIEGSRKVGIHVQKLGAGRLFNVTVANCSTFMTFSSGILFGRVTKAEIVNCVVRRACQYGWQECITLNDTDSFNVSGNVVFDRPYLRIPFEIPADENSEILRDNNGNPIVRGGEGIDAKVGSSDGTISQNLVASINKFGIYVDGYDGESSNIHIFNNFIFNVGSGIAVATENGGLTRDISIYGNVVALCRAGLYLNDHGGGSSHEVRNIEVHYNTFFANRVAGINVTNPELTGLNVTNNISVNNGGTDLNVRADAGYSMRFSNNLIGVALFDGNPLNPGFYDPTYDLEFDSLNQLVPGESVIQANEIWDPADWDVPWEQRIGQIYLWDASLYLPVKGSRALDSGTPEFPLTDGDLFGNKRNTDLHPKDIGAVEKPRN